MRRGTVKPDIRIQQKQERWDGSRNEDRWEKARRMLTRRTRMSSTESGGASSY